MNVSPKIYELLKELVDDIGRFFIRVHSPNKKGDGFLGEMCFVSLEDKHNDEVLHFVVKEAFTDEIIRSGQPIRDVFLNEIYFYSKLWPRLREFQEDLLETKIFDKFCKCFKTRSEENFEKLVLENLKFQGFEVFDRRGTFDKDHMEFVLREYGKFHAVSVAFRALYPEEYSELTEGLIDQFSGFIGRKEFQGAVKGFHQMCLLSLEAGKDDDVIEKYKRYAEDGVELFRDSNNYEGKYPVLLHGDCWGNNMMFKYDENNKLEDIRLIDLQLIKSGSAVADLAYCIYASGSRETFSDLNHYLQVYHESLSDSIRLFGLDPNHLFPFSVLKDEWKRHLNVGFTMSLMLWKSKLTHEEDVIDFTDMTGDREELTEKYMKARYDEEEFRKRTRDLIVHLYENDFL